MREDRNVPVLHNIFFINYFTCIFPIFITCATYIIFFSCKHKIKTDNENYFFPAPSDIIYFEPEYRIYSVFMTIESFLLLFVFYVQDKVRVIIAKRLNKSKTKKFKIIRIITYLGFLFYFFGHEILAIIQYKNFSKKSVTFAFLANYFNSLGGICLFLSCDILNAYLNHSSSIVSRILTWIIFLTSLFHVLIRYCVFTDPKSSNVQWWTMSTAFFIIQQWCGYSKFLLISNKLPSAAIRVSRNIV